MHQNLDADVPYSFNKIIMGVEQGDAFDVFRHGERVAVIISAEDYSAIVSQAARTQ